MHPTGWKQGTMLSVLNRSGPRAPQTVLVSTTTNVLYLPAGSCRLVGPHGNACTERMKAMVLGMTDTALYGYYFVFGVLHRTRGYTGARRRNLRRCPFLLARAPSRFPFLSCARALHLSLSLLLSLAIGKLHTMDVYKQLTRNVAAIWFTSCITGLRRV